MSVVLVVFGLVLACIFIAVARVRWLRQRPVPDAVPCCTIAELESGRFRITGRVVPRTPLHSSLDGASCVYIEHADYQTVGSDFVPILKQLRREVTATPFFVDDGTGAVLVDPSQVTIEGVTLVEDDGLTMETRLRAGEDVELVATFAQATAVTGSGPYRAGERAYRPVADMTGRPRVSYRTEPGMVVATDDVTAFFGGAGVLTLIFTVAFGLLSL